MATAATPGSSDKVLTDINEQIMLCAICLERFKSPKILPCYHTYCEVCLTEWVNENNGQLICPTCRELHPLPSGGVKAITNNRFMNDLLQLISDISPEAEQSVCEGCDSEAKHWCTDCGQFFCDECIRTHRVVRSLKDHKVMTVEEYNEKMSSQHFRMIQPRFCESHPSTQLEFYCDTCQLPTCMKCSIVHHVPPEHKTISIESALEKYMPTMKQYTKTVEQKVIDLKQTKDRVSSDGVDLEKMKTTAESQIKDFAKSVFDKLKQQELELQAEVSDIYAPKRKQIDSQIELLEHKLVSAESMQSYLNHLLTFGGPVDIMTAKTEMEQRLQQHDSQEVQYSDNHDDSDLVFTENPACPLMDLGYLGANVGSQIFEQVVATFDLQNLSLPQKKALSLVQQSARDAETTCHVKDGTKVLIKGNLSNIIKFHDKIQLSLQTPSVESIMATDSGDLQDNHNSHHERDHVNDRSNQIVDVVCRPITQVVKLESEFKSFKAADEFNERNASVRNDGQNGTESNGNIVEQVVSLGACSVVANENQEQHQNGKSKHGEIREQDRHSSLNQAETDEDIAKDRKMQQGGTFSIKMTETVKKSAKVGAQVNTYDDKNSTKTPLDKTPSSKPKAGPSTSNINTASLHLKIKTPPTGSFAPNRKEEDRELLARKIEKQKRVSERRGEVEQNEDGIDSWEIIPGDNDITPSDRLGQGRDNPVSQNKSRDPSELERNVQHQAKDMIENKPNVRDNKTSNDDKELSVNKEDQGKDNKSSKSRTKQVSVTEDSVKPKRIKSGLNAKSLDAQGKTQPSKALGSGQLTPPMNAVASGKKPGTGSPKEQPNDRLGKCSMNENYEVLHYIQERYSDKINDISVRNKVVIEWKPSENKESVFFLAQGDNLESAYMAKKEFETLVREVKGRLKNKVIDCNVGRSFTKEEATSAHKLLDVAKDKIVAICQKSEKKYVFLSENATILNKFADLFCESLGMRIAVTKTKDGGAKSKPQVDQPPDQGDTLVKQATVGKDILDYVFHVYEKKLAKEGKDAGIVYERKGHDLFIKPCDKKKAKSTQEDLEKIYDKFASFVQNLHSQLTSRDVDVSHKGVSLKSVNQAIQKIHSKHEKVFISQIETDKYRVYADKSDIRVAMNDFYTHLGLSAPQVRHGGGGRKHGGLQRSDSNSGGQTLSKTSVVPSLEFQSKDGTKVSVLVGDITKEDVDIICNAANSQLSHGGGVAGAIVKAGGSSIQVESYQWLRKLGRDLEVAEYVYTDAGRLPCQFVLHVVGPRWNDIKAKQIRDQLYNCCYNVLRSANKDKGKSSIAIPAIGTGIYGVPNIVCAQIMFDAVFDFINNQRPLDQLRDIRFIDIDEETVQTFVAEFESSLSAHKIRYKKQQSHKNSADFLGADGGEGSSVDPVPSGRASSGHHYQRSYAAAAAAASGSVPSNPTNPDEDDKKCAICLDEIQNLKMLPCKHTFCKPCIDRAVQSSGPKCPTCTQPFGTLTGNMPHGTMRESTHTLSLPGYKYCGSIWIEYYFADGIQGADHPNPGKWYSGTGRTAYLPDNYEGREVLRLLKAAFDRKLTFTIGTSATTGRNNVVTWNDIHHKTSTTGGPQNFGYPDPTYLKRVKEELASKGVK